MTARSWQSAAKKKGLPWTAAKVSIHVLATLPCIEVSLKSVGGAGVRHLVPARRLHPCRQGSRSCLAMRFSVLTYLVCSATRSRMSTR